MKMDEASSVLWELNPDEKIEFYTGDDGTIVAATRTDKICNHDFAVSLLISGKEEFCPTHVRVLFDLYLKKLRNEKDAKKLFCTIERLYDGEDPLELAKEVKNLNFPMQLDGADVNLYCIQLLMIEQDFNYGSRGCKEGKVQPPREFFMRFIRWVESGDDELDRIIQCAVRNYPPKVQYAKRIECL